MATDAQTLPVVEESRPTQIPSNEDESIQKKGYLVIDHGEELRRQFQDCKQETNRQIKDLYIIIHLLWEVFWNFMIVTAQIALGWSLMTFIKITSSKSLEGLAVAFNCAICINILLFDAIRLKDNILKLLVVLDKRKPETQEQSVNTDSTKNGSQDTESSGSEEEEGEGEEDSDTPEQNSDQQSVENVGENKEKNSEEKGTQVSSNNQATENIDFD